MGLGKSKKEILLERFEATEETFDAHMHLPWFSEEVRGGLKNKIFGQTVTPSEYEETVRFAQGDVGCLGLGLHPWYIEQASVEDFERLAKTTDLIGEIGLDFVHDSYTWANDNGFDVVESPVERQIEVFTRVCQAIQPGSFVSVHAVGTKGTAHKILQETGVLEHSTVIYHWFSDDGDTLHQAIKDGCLFSINTWMLDTRRGREYAKQIPASQKLWETDQPEGKNAPYNFDYPGNF